MLDGKKIIVVLPAFNAEKTLEQTYKDIPSDIVDEIILVDDKSSDQTVTIAKKLDISVITHEENRGYGGNQKTCYAAALDKGADVVIMVHPDYQYTPHLITSMASLITLGVFDCVLGSRILGVGALKGGMPLYKYLSNRVLTLIQNLLLSYKLSEYHTGYRAYNRQLLELLPFEKNADGFEFDNQILAQIIYAGYAIGEITCPTRYTPESSSINLKSSIGYGLQVLRISIAYRLSRWGIYHSQEFRNMKIIADG